MLRSNRFTTVVTAATADRLARACENRPPIARRERHRGAVVAIQTTLASLNDGYMAGAEIDGYFGNGTLRAVEAFQRDYGLVADGVVGAQVLAQLDEIYAGEDARPPRGVSLHVGVDRVDPAHYGSDLALPSCVNDAREMEMIADALGYDTARLENDQATCSNVAGFLRHVAGDLLAGDALFLTYSGHGSQVPNDSDDEEADLMDETLVLHDRMMIDDEVYGLLQNFREGVRVHMVFDSCHSATVFKQLKVAGVFDMVDAIRKDFRADALRAMENPAARGADAGAGAPSGMHDQITMKSLSAALDGDRPKTKAPVPLPAKLKEETADLFADLAINTLTGPAKFVDGHQFFHNNKDVYDAVRVAVGSRERARLACTVTAFSAAMDSQTTPAGNPLSLFTFNLSRVWDRGSFRGSYSDFHRVVVRESRPDATPQLRPEGSLGAAARLRERPFAF